MAIVNSLETELNDFYRLQCNVINDLRKAIADIEQHEELQPRKESWITSGQGSNKTFYAFSDGSAITPDGSRTIYGCGSFFGRNNSNNLASPASPTCQSTLGAEIQAARLTLETASKCNITNLTVYLDNLAAKSTIQAIFSGRAPQQSLMADLVASDNHTLQELRKISNILGNFNNLSIGWIRSHQSVISWKQRGNDESDKLAKEGALKMRNEMGEVHHSSSDSGSDEDNEADEVDEAGGEAVIAEAEEEMDQLFARLRADPEPR